MSIPYRTRRACKRLFIVLLVLAVFAFLIAVCWLLWLNRYVVYSRDGATLNFDISVSYGEGITPTQPQTIPVPEIHDAAKDNQGQDDPNEFAAFSGYYVSLNELTGDFDGVCEKLSTLPRGSTVMLELKDVRSYAYYSSSVCVQPTDFDVTKTDELIQTLQSKGHYVIAKIPAFQEYWYILEDERGRVPFGLAKAGGSGVLWLDTSGTKSCYWLDPSSDGTMTYLLQQVAELRNLGLDEVVFSDFRIPDTDKIEYGHDIKTVLESTAATLVNTCSTESFCVSFERTGADLSLPEGRTRLYIRGASAANVESIAAACTLPDPSAQLVFLTDSGDPRFDGYCVLRPLDSLE